MPKLKRQATKSAPAVQLIRHNELPVAVVLDIDAYEDLLEQANPRIRRELDQAYQEVEQGKTISQEDLFRRMGI